MPERPTPRLQQRALTPGLLLLVLIALPIVWIIGYSIAYSLGGIGLLSAGWTVTHWRAVMNSGELWSSLLYSTTIALVVTGVATSLALTFTLVAPHSRNRNWTLALLCVPLATPALVMAVIVHQLLNPGGVLARVLATTGWISSPSQFPVFVQDRWAVGIIVAGICGAVPLLTLYFLKTWTTARIDHYCRLAESLGSTTLAARTRIAAPMLLKRARSLMLLTFLWTLGSYEVPLLLGVQSPQMFSVLIQRRAGRFDLHQRPESFALAVSYLTLCSAGVIALLRLNRETAEQVAPVILANAGIQSPRVANALDSRVRGNDEVDSKPRSPHD